MQETTIEDRKKELRSLLDQIEAHPEKAFTEERKRVAVLQNMLAAHEKAQG
ncbi:M20 family metallopeptidase [Alteraurantiacibacter aquimixticola]|uniref:M20 family metallopeptidase n=1 Tax=Alteraurantiacibacter aquimixticola TaxID=2489173 RepID=UPI0010AA870F|nr:M20 family metallopeptidase [Alteraurantiacibacter aquimixticola]